MKTQFDNSMASLLWEVLNRYPNFEPQRESAIFLGNRIVQFSNNENNKDYSNQINGVIQLFINTSGRFIKILSSSKQLYKDFSDRIKSLNEVAINISPNTIIWEALRRNEPILVKIEFGSANNISYNTYNCFNIDEYNKANNFNNVPLKFQTPNSELKLNKAIYEAINSLIKDSKNKILNGSELNFIICKIGTLSKTSIVLNSPFGVLDGLEIITFARNPVIDVDGFFKLWATSEFISIDKILSHHSFVISKKMENEYLNIEIMDYIHQISHRVKGPLLHMRGNISEITDLIDRHILDERRKEEFSELINSIDESIDRISTFVAFIENYTVLNKNEFQENDLNKIISEAHIESQRIFHNINIKYENFTSNAITVCVEFEIAFVIRELIYNSYKQFDKYDIESRFITIILSEILDEKNIRVIKAKNKVYSEKMNYYKIVYKDNGQGIEEGRKESVFFHKNYTNKEQSNGGNRGLPLVRKYIEDSHAGVVYECGTKGVEFVLLIPKIINNNK